MQALEKLRPLALLLLRLALAAVFIYHGYPKLFGHTHESMQSFVHLGLPGYFAYISGLLEFFGGCTLIVGLFTPIAGLLLTIEMVIAMWKSGRLTSDPMAVRGYELPLALAVSAFVLATFGAGLLSLDHALFGGGRSAPRKSKQKGSARG
jgi:putative oxidoreductase